jgi:adenylate cyclase class 2
MTAIEFEAKLLDIDPERLRDNGAEVTLCVKEIHPDAIDGVTETETTVGGFETADALLGMLGYRPKAYQENRRSSWTLGGAAVEIDIEAVPRLTFG